MKHIFSSITLAVATFTLMLSATLVLNAQNREKFGITARAGGINTVSGRVELRTFRGGDWVTLNVTDDLKTGDVVKTGMDGRVEMLLNPGSYLRVGENSEFELTDNSLENLEVRLTRGTAIIEATGAEGTELAINITTPHAKMVIVRRGLYRVSVISGDATELFVRKGRVLVANSHTKVKEGNKVVFSSTAFSVAKLVKPDKRKDSFEGWSKTRSETLALANRRIERRESVLLASMYGYYARYPGIWFYNTGYHCYTFLPFQFGWGSPYGNSYSGVYFAGSYHCCGGSPYYYNPTYNGSGPGSGTGYGGNSGGSSGSSSGGGNIGRTPPPSPAPQNNPEIPSRGQEKTPEAGRPIAPR
jgi:uncharacterized membrane protein YgcG